MGALLQMALCGKLAAMVALSDDDRVHAQLALNGALHVLLSNQNPLNGVATMWNAVESLVTEQHFFAGFFQVVRLLQRASGCNCFAKPSRNSGA
jgi:hypothetical protein